MVRIKVWFERCRMLKRSASEFDVLVRRSPFVLARSITGAEFLIQAPVAEPQIRREATGHSSRNAHAFRGSGAAQRGDKAFAFFALHQGVPVVLPPVLPRPPFANMITGHRLQLASMAAMRSGLLATLQVLASTHRSREVRSVVRRPTSAVNSYLHGVAEPGRERRKALALLYDERIKRFDRRGPRRKEKWYRRTRERQSRAAPGETSDLRQLGPGPSRRVFGIGDLAPVDAEARTTRGSEREGHRRHLARRWDGHRQV